MESLNKRVRNTIAGGLALLGATTTEASSSEPEKLDLHASPTQSVQFLREYSKEGGDKYETFIGSIRVNGAWYTLADKGDKGEGASASVESKTIDRVFEKLQTLIPKGTDSEKAVIWEFHNHTLEIVHDYAFHAELSKADITNKNRLLLGPSPGDCQRISSYIKSIEDFKKNVTVVVEPFGLWICSAPPQSKIMATPSNTRWMFDDQLGLLYKPLMLATQSGSDAVLKEAIDTYEKKFEEISGVRIKYVPFDTPEEEILAIGNSMMNE